MYQRAIYFTSLLAETKGLKPLTLRIKIACLPEMEKKREGEKKYQCYKFSSCRWSFIALLLPALPSLSGRVSSVDKMQQKGAKKYELCV